jgi:hypothetical protein
MNIKLPIELAVIDYHEFDYAQDYLRQIIPGVKVKELAFNGKYLGIVYHGKLKDPVNAEMVKRIRAKNDSDFD